MQMTVIDPDGMEAARRVRVHLRRAMRGTNVAVTLGTCDSNTSSATGPQALNCVLPNVVDDPPGSWYWWEVLIEHSAAAVNAEFLGVIPTHGP